MAISIQDPKDPHGGYNTASPKANPSNSPTQLTIEAPQPNQAPPKTTSHLYVDRRRESADYIYYTSSDGNNNNISLDIRTPKPSPGSVIKFSFNGEDVLLLSGDNKSGENNEQTG